jgi:hypothetical protein
MTLRDCPAVAVVLLTNSPPARFERRVVTVVEADFAFQQSIFLQLHPAIARSMIHFVAAFPGEIDT